MFSKLIKHDGRNMGFPIRDPDILSTIRAYLCVIADKHFLIDPHAIVKASMCDRFIFFNCPVSRL